MPTASHVLITADILCGSKTFSSSTVRSGWRLFNTEVRRSFLSGVMLQFTEEYLPAAKMSLPRIAQINTDGLRAADYADVAENIFLNLRGNIFATGKTVRVNLCNPWLYQNSRREYYISEGNKRIFLPINIPA